MFISKLYLNINLSFFPKQRKTMNNPKKVANFEAAYKR